MRRLSRLLSRTSITDKPSTPGRVPHKAPLLELPVEVLLLIEAHLLYENALCLSLTCKQAYNLFFLRLKPDKKHRNRESNFLRLLERDHPSLLSCPYHEILYNWQKRQGKRYRCPRCNGTGQSMVICNKACRVGFLGIFDAERRLMIRHSFLSPQHGISMRSLNHVCKRSKSKEANEITPKITRQSLMVWRTHNFTTHFDFLAWADLALESCFNEAICVHSERNVRTLVVACICHARRRWRWLLLASTPSRSYMDHFASWRCPTLFKCAQCSTDVRLSMDQVSQSQINIRLDVFQDLGGLNEMTMSQRQVLGTRFGSNHRNLTRDEKIERLRENLEKRYFGQSEVAEKYCEGIPWNTAFLGQWWYNFSHMADQPVFFRPEQTIPRPIWLAYRKIQFKKERDAKGNT